MDNSYDSLIPTKVNESMFYAVPTKHGSQNNQDFSIP